MDVIDRDLNDYLRDCEAHERMESRVEQDTERLLNEPEFSLFHPDTISEALGDYMYGHIFDKWCEILAKGDNDKSINFLSLFAETARLERAERAARKWLEKHKNDYEE